MATNKARVNLYVDRDVYNRLKRVIARIPGLSASQIFENSMRVSLPSLEELAGALESGDRNAVVQAMQLMVGRQVETLGIHASAMRTKLEEEEG